MTDLPELFQIKGLAGLIFEYVLPAQKKQWFLQASYQNDWPFVCFLLGVCSTLVDLRIKLKLFSANCIDVLMILKGKGYLHYSEFVSSTWQNLFARASYPMRLFLWGIVPQTMLLGRLDMLHETPNQFETFYGDLDPANQFIVFKRLCEQGHLSLVSKCLSIHPGNHAWFDSVLVEFCNFFTISWQVLDLLLGRGVGLFTIRTMHKHCFKHMDRILNDDVSVVYVLCKYSIILEHEHLLYFNRAVQLQRLDHVEFFWQPQFDTNLYIPSATCNETIDEADMYPGETIISHPFANEFCPPQMQTKFDLIFKNLCLRIQIPRDLPLPNNLPRNFAQHMSGQIHHHYSHLGPTERVELFGKSCRFHMLTIAQYLWFTSGSRLKHLFAASFVDARAGDNRAFLEFLWSASPQEIVGNARIFAVTALRACNFVLWQFLFDHGLLLSDFIFDAAQAWVVASLCKVSSKFLKLVWNSDDQAWQNNYQTMLSAAIVNKRRSIVCFLAKLNLPLSKDFLMEHRLYWFHHNIMSMVRRLQPSCDDLSSELLYNLLVFAAQNDWGDLFEELLRFGTLTYDMVIQDYFKLFQFACLSCSRAARILFQRFPMILHDAVPFLNSEKCSYVIQLLDEQNWDVDFSEEEQLPPLFLSWA